MSKITFSYIETHDFQEDLEITMEVAERTIDEMCEYFQRFLSAAGYLFEEGHTIRCVPPGKTETDLPGCGGDVLTFNHDGSYVCYDFGDNNPVYFGSGVQGGMANDIISFS